MVKTVFTTGTFEANTVGCFVACGGNDVHDGYVRCGRRGQRTSGVQMRYYMDRTLYPNLRFHFLGLPSHALRC